MLLVAEYHVGYVDNLKGLNIVLQEYSSEYGTRTWSCTNLVKIQQSISKTYILVRDLLMNVHVSQSET